MHYLFQEQTNKKHFTKETRSQLKRGYQSGSKKMELAYSFSLEPTKGRLRSITITKFAFKRVPTAVQKVTLADLGIRSYLHLSSVVGSLLLCAGGVNPDFRTTGCSPPSRWHKPILRICLIEVITERNLQILVESHSEHLLTRLQRRIAEEKICFRSDCTLFLSER